MQDGTTCEGSQMCGGVSDSIVNVAGQCLPVTVRYLHRTNGVYFKLWHQMGAVWRGNAVYTSRDRWLDLKVRQPVRNARCPLDLCSNVCSHIVKEV